MLSCMLRAAGSFTWAFRALAWASIRFRLCRAHWIVGAPYRCISANTTFPANFGIILRHRFAAARWPFPLFRACQPGHSHFAIKFAALIWIYLHLICLGHLGPDLAHLLSGDLLGPGPGLMLGIVLGIWHLGHPDHRHRDLGIIRARHRHLGSGHHPGTGRPGGHHLGRPGAGLAWRHIDSVGQQ